MSPHSGPFADSSRPLTGTTESTAPSPEVAQAVTRAMTQALEDPEVQSQLVAGARRGAHRWCASMQDVAASGVGEIKRYFQMGPTGLSTMCTLSGVALIVISILDAIDISNIKSPFQYFLNMYLFVIGWVVLFLEANLERMQMMTLIRRIEPCVRRWQEWVHREMHFLTYLKTRGFFYLFVGLLCAMQCFICLTFPIGLWTIIAGIGCITTTPKPAEPHAEPPAEACVTESSSPHADPPAEARVAEASSASERPDHGAWPMFGGPAEPPPRTVTVC
eukprot:TRINITY_DN58115_c0_g1_i1.p1 TRINITY_DN58115_c0_g1~~TRINITY_DN58115_c0_g1_i1.p1  ORF type:complete len:276 (-),score=24.28 TRINITY_DN58115_c0_g1_i1:137-964(-)